MVSKIEPLSFHSGVSPRGRYTFVYPGRHSTERWIEPAFAAKSYIALFVLEIHLLASPPAYNHGVEPVSPNEKVEKYNEPPLTEVGR